MNGAREVTVFVDTSKIKEVTLTLSIDGVEYTKTQSSGQKRTQLLLPMLHVLLREHNLSLADICSFTVNPGPGSFTGLRVGLSVVNMLGLVLGVPVNGTAPPVFPSYE